MQDGIEYNVFSHWYDSPGIEPRSPGPFGLTGRLA